ncbi:MAG TPA: hypothetical protein PLN02_00830 [Azonexus sp.]|nr:hypothetical protein [Azonexus sp.]
MNATDIATIAATVLAVVPLVAGTYKFAHAKGVKEGRRELNYARELEALQHLYAPLVSLFLDVHISSCTLTRYPTFRQRLKHAIAIFRERRYLKFKLKHAFQALFDKGTSEPSVGVDYGPGFPLSKIGGILKHQTHLAPGELISLYRTMSRDEYERIGASEDELFACHLEFLDHIFDEHRRLSERVRSNP